MKAIDFDENESPLELWLLLNLLDLSKFTLAEAWSFAPATKDFPEGFGAGKMHQLSPLIFVTECR